MPWQQRQLGFSLVEVLVAVLISSIGILGMASLQLTSLKSTNHSFFRTQASLFSYEIIDDMRANRKAAVNQDYNLSLSQLSDLTNPGANGSIADNEIYQWLRKMSTALPQSKASIDCDLAATCKIIIQWSNHTSQQTSVLTVAAQL